MAETSNLLISKAREFLATKTSEEVATAIRPLFTRQETTEYKAARALHECCVANFPHFLIPKLLTAYLNTSDGVLRFRTIYLLSEFRNRSNVHLSPSALRVIKPLVVACLKMKETKESDVKILRRIVSFVAYSVVTSDDGGWDELSDCILEFADTYPCRAFHVFLDLPLVYIKRFIHQDVMERVLDQAKKVLFSPDKARAEDWSLALQTLFKIGVLLGSDVVVESIVLKSAEEVVKIGKREFLERGLEDINKFLARDGCLCQYSKEQRVFVSRLAFNIAASCHGQTIEDSEKVASEIARLVRKPNEYYNNDESGFDIDWCDHLSNLSPLQVLRVFARADDLGERCRELAIRRLHASLSHHDSVVGTSRHVSLMRKLQPLLISCLEEDGISDSIFEVLCEVVNYVNSDMLIFVDETWQGLRDYIVSKTKTKFQRAVYVFSCLTEQLDVDKFVIPVMLNLLPEISARLNPPPPRELLVVVDDSWVLAFTGAFCAIIYLINIDTYDDLVKEIAYKMVDSVRELVERGMEVGVVRRGFRDLESIVKKQLTWYDASEYKFVKGLLWRLYEIKGMKMESKVVLWRINAIVERGVTEEDKELPEGEIDWINQD